MVMWMDVPAGLSKRAIHDFAGGYSSAFPSFDLNDDQYIEGYGWNTDKWPALSVRKGYSHYGASGGDKTNLLTNYGNVQLIRAVGTKLQRDNGGTWTDISTGFANEEWDAANFDINGPVVIMTNGTDAVRYWNGSALNSISSAPKGKYIASDNRRVYIANVADEESQDVVHYCAFQDASDWSTELNSGAVQYYTARGGPITALYSFEGRIWAFKKDAFALIFHTGDARATHRLVEVSNDIGCIEHKTLAECGPRLFWLGYDDVYMGAGGNAIGVGEPIRKFLNDINNSHYSECFGFSDGLRYYLGIPTGNRTKANIILVFDPRRKGDPWNVYANISDMRYAVYLNNELFAGGESGQTYKLNDGTTDAGSAIPYRVVTRDFDEGIPEAEKEYYELHLQVDISTGTTMTIEASVDQGGTYIPIGDPITSKTTSQNVNVIIPLDTVPLGNWIRFRISGTGQFTLYRLQRYFRVQPVQH